MQMIKLRDINDVIADLKNVDTLYNQIDAPQGASNKINALLRKIRTLELVQNLAVVQVAKSVRALTAQEIAEEARDTATDAIEEARELIDAATEAEEFAEIGALA